MHVRVARARQLAFHGFGDGVAPDPDPASVDNRELLYQGATTLIERQHAPEAPLERTEAPAPQVWHTSSLAAVICQRGASGCAMRG